MEDNQDYSSKAQGDSPQEPGEPPQKTGDSPPKKREPIQFDRQLIERFASGNGTVFVGAGISMRSRLPSWAKLMEPLREELGDKISSSASHLDVAELYEAEHGRSALVRYLKRELGDVRYQLSRTHDLIVSLPVQRIYTTNFDNLLERAAHKKGLNRDVIHDASHVGFSDISTLSIVKLHGDLGAPRSLVISANDYYGYFTKNPAVADLLKVELQTRTVLFLGYSFSDPDFGMILGKVAAQSGPDGPLLYALLLNPLELATKGLDKRGIKVIPLKAKPGTREANKEVEYWLDCFLQTLRKSERRKRQQASPVGQMHDKSGIPKYKHSLIRSRTLRRIEDVLRADSPVIVVKGEAGIGKTQLVATAAAHMRVPGGAVVVNDVFENIIWIRAASKEPTHKLSHILRTIVNSLESFPTEGSNMEEMEEQATLVLEEHRVIVVIEDLEDGGCDDKQIDSIKKWLEHLGSEAHPKSRIVVTSRSLNLLGFMVEVGRLRQEEAEAMLVEHAESIMLRRAIHGGLAEEDVKWLANRTLGNPQAIQLALGLIFGTESLAAKDGPAAKKGLAVTKEVLTDLKPNEDIQSVFGVLIDAAWEQLSTASRQILRAMSVFPEAEPVPEKLLKVACGKDHNAGDSAFSEAAERCVRFGLLEYDASKDTFGLHRTSKKLLAKHFDKLDPDKPFEHLADYLLTFLRDEPGHNVVRRSEIGEEYWNALVRDQMSKVDPYWPIIRHVMSQPGPPERIVEFVLLLVHYMDSRFLNADRAEFLNLAMEALEKMPLEKKAWSDKKRALLKIDALAWTYMENNKHLNAAREINEGLDLIRGNEEDNQDLVALAAAWRARMESEETNYAEAHTHLDEAWEAAKNAGKQWICMRVKMIQGDVLHRESKAQKVKTAELAELTEKEQKAKEAKEKERLLKKAREALEAYREAEHWAEQYGGEGNGYQTSPRIAFALLEQTDNATAQEEAAQRFRKLVENSGIATGRLYGQYGNALIAAKNNATREAIAQLEEIHREIYHLGKGNVLLSLAENLYRKTLKQRSYYTENAGRA